MATSTKRIDPKDAHEHMNSNAAMLVCAYDAEEKFEQNHLKGAISLVEFGSQADWLPKDKEIIFYCA